MVMKLQTHTNKVEYWNEASGCMWNLSACMLSRMLDLIILISVIECDHQQIEERQKNCLQSLLMRSRFLKPNFQLSNPTEVRRKHHRRLDCVGDQA